MEMESSKIDFKELYKVTKIDLDIVTFKKYEIRRNAGIVAKFEHEIVDLGKEIGEETHVCKLEIVAELAGKVGLIIKGFNVEVTGKKKKKVSVSKIIYLDKE